MTEQYTGRYVAMTNDKNLIEPLVKEYGFEDTYLLREIELNDEIRSDKEGQECTQFKIMTIETETNS
jgi:hypothetical protein